MAVPDAPLRPVTETPQPPAARPPGGSRAGLAAIAVGAAVPTLMLLAGLLAPLPHDPRGTDAAAVLLPPGGAHWFGTDDVGADVFSKTVAAAATDIPLALAGTLAALLVGVPLGVLLSNRRRWAEAGMRVVDGFQSLPLLILVLAVVALSGNKLWTVVLAVAVYGAPVYIRLVRSQLLTIREARFVEAARVAGAGTLHVMRRHLLPNVREVVLAQTGLVLAGSLLGLAALSFLGVGVRPPTPSWGSMVARGSSSLVSGQWWPALFPGAAVFVCVVCVNLVADGLRRRWEAER